ncbi:MULTISPECIES: hypothetical protein [unclassified Legionella]|uniref:hypothetical protein n=1 Tax=unclassified Legionella TaxID=2622702 RepID=UPI001E35B4D8|nr:hypothetical protein [Legionella sp. 31fI33]MCC5013736.1 hypothetical protein [Legionella sp. 31fI33]
MKEYTKAKIASDLQLDLLQFLDDDQLKADVLDYLLAPLIELKNKILIQYGKYLPVSDDKRTQQIRKLFADDFLRKYPHYRKKLEGIFETKWIAIEAQVAHVIAYRIEGYTKNVYEVEIPGSSATYNEERTYLQALASAVAGTPNAEKLEQDDIALVIGQIVQTHLADLAKKGIYPTSSEIVQPGGSMRYKPKEDNNHAFLFNTTATLSGILSAGAFTAALLALKTIITISTAGVGLLASVGVVAGLVSFGLYSSNKEQKEHTGDQIVNVLQ